MRRLAARLLGLFLGLAMLGAVRDAAAAPHGPFNHSDEPWRVIETKYFRIYASEKNPNTARHLIRIADATFERLNRFYGATLPGKIAVSIVGYVDYSNAFADANRNRITIYATPADFHSRSRVPWLDNVFTHELSHILSLNAASYWSPSVPLVLGTGLARRPTSQALVRVPLYTRNLPHWFVEGVAQFDTRLLGRDSFDENRAAFQRAAWEDRLFFPLGKLAFFGREKWYNTGFSFLLFLDERFGSGTTHRLFLAAGQRHNLLFDDLFEDVLGVPLAELEAEYRRRVRRDFERHWRLVQRGAFDGQPLIAEDQELRYRDLTPLQKDDLRADYRAKPLRVIHGRLFYEKNGELRHAKFSPKTLKLSDDRELGQGEMVAANGAHGYFVLRQEGHKPSLVPDWYRPEFESQTLLLTDGSGNERPLMKDSRLMDFDVCAKRRELAGVYNDGDGSLSLVLYPLERFGTGEVAVDTAHVVFPLPPQDLDEVRSPRYSPDCSRLFFSRRAGDDHDIYAWNFAEQRLETFVAEDSFELYPTPTERGVYFVSARDGTMSIYFRSYQGGPIRRVSEAVTAHHYPVPYHGDGVLFSRLHSTGFQAYFLSRAAYATTRPVVPQTKPDAAQWSPIETWGFPTGPYQAFDPRNLSGPLIVPIFDVEYESPAGAAAQVGAEVFVEDALRTHALRLNGFVGDRTSIWANYANSMTPLTWQIRGGMTSLRSRFIYERADGDAFDQVQTGSWGFVYTSISTPVNLFYDLGVEAETIRDTGATVGARSWPFSFSDPRFARDRAGLFVAYDGLDRSSPVFRERVVNKRGYRTFDLSAGGAVEDIHPLIEALEPSIRSGRKPYVRVEFNHHEYIALPELMRGYFDHSLQLDLSLGYISRDIQFLPFYGGGRLRSLTTPELVSSVGFAGYSAYSLRGETLANLGVSYRFPLARELDWDWGVFYLEDVYAQVFSSWGNIWGFDPNGKRQWPLVDRAPNGGYVMGDVGADLRLNHFVQELEANVGTTFRVAYRVVPFTACDNIHVSPRAECLGVNGQRGLMAYLMLGAGF